ncbi:MAG: hypothetical protein OEY70_00225 [Acidimicrobiia bacterium]|nr:hypothetical protein [Acidimicrobiia bacterium]
MAASQLLHPSGMMLTSSTYTEGHGIEAPLLAQIAGGLAASAETTAPAGDRTVLVVTAGFEAALEWIPADDTSLMGLVEGQPVAFAVVSGQLLVWTADDGSHALGPGGSCAVGPAERVQLVNVTDEPAQIVTVRALAGDRTPHSLRRR